MRGRAARRDLGLALALAAALFAVYAAGAARTIAVGDSGELVTAAWVFGVPHPSGYPLYVLLAKLWSTLLPVGSVAFRVSLFSAACAALACAVLFLVCRRLGGGRAAALTAAGCLAFAPSFWGEANIQRVYALNALFLAMALWLACGWWLRRRGARPAPPPSGEGTIALTVLVAALGAGNHTFMAVFGVTFGVWALFQAPELVLRPRTLALVAAAVVLGLLPYAWLPLAAQRQPPLLWGDPGSLSGFLDIVLRRDFWDRAWVASPADAATVAADWAVSVGRELTWVGAAMALLGVCAAARRRHAPVLLLLAVMLANLASMMLHGSRSDLFVWHRYYIPSYLVAALFVGRGAEALTRRAPRALRLLPLLLPALLFAAGWARFDRRDDRIADTVAGAILDQVPPGGVLLAADDSVLYPLLYLTLVDGHRTDVRVGLLDSVALPAAADFDPQATPVVFTHPPDLADDALVAVPVGLTFRLWKRGLPPPPAVPVVEELPGVGAVAARDALTRHLIGHVHFTQGLALADSDWPRARRHFDRAAAVAADHDALLFNLGVLYLRRGMMEEGIAALEQADRISPRGLESAPAVRAADLLAQLRAAAR